MRMNLFIGHVDEPCQSLKVLSTFLRPGASDFAEPASGAALPPPALSWVWLVDLERTAALLVGRCLGGMLQGAPTSPEEQDTGYWLKTPLFSNGLETDVPQLGTGGGTGLSPLGRAVPSL